MKLSLRDFIKRAGPKEAKRATGLNWEHIREILSEGGTREVSRDEIQANLGDESKLLFSNPVIEIIRSIELSPEARKRVNELEAALLIIGAVLHSGTEGEVREKIALLNWYLEYMELKPGSLGLSGEALSSSSKIKEEFNSIYGAAENKKRESEAQKSEAKGSDYLSNDVKYDFGDGWKVVYIPAVGEMEGYPGLQETSHDRVLEGNKNGLCLGAGTRYYQDNSQGKIYSVRDQSNKPRVTIRILDNALQEAKGKNNNPPDADGAIHATKWFESQIGLSYQKNTDFLRFPPTNRDDAIQKFLEDSLSPYDEKWVSSWYKKGIPELDEDVMEKVSENDPLIFQSGLGKTHYELALPVVKHWAQEYVNRPSNSNKGILFGAWGEAPEHEVFKTYRKIPEMQAAVQKLAEKDPYWFFVIGLQSIPEYLPFSEGPIRSYSRSNPDTFLDEYSEYDWAKPYIEETITNYLDQYSKIVFVQNFYKKEFAKPYLDKFIRESLEDTPYRILLDSKYRTAEWFTKEYIIFGFKELFKSDCSDFIKLICREENSEIKNDLTEEITKALQRCILTYPKSVIYEAKTLIEYGFSEYVLLAIDAYMEKDGSKPMDILEITNSIDEESEWLGEERKNRLLDLAVKSDPLIFFKRYVGDSKYDKQIRVAISLLLLDHPGMIIDYAEPVAEMDGGIEYILFDLKTVLNKDPKAILRKISFGGYHDEGKYKFYEEMKPYVDFAIKYVAENEPRDFLSYVGASYARPYLKSGLENMAKKEPRLYLSSVKSSPTVRNTVIENNYIGLALSKLLEGPKEDKEAGAFFIQSDFFYGKYYFDDFFSKYAETYPEEFLLPRTSSGDPSIEKYIDIAARKMIENDPARFLERYGHMKKYTDLAKEKLLDKNSSAKNNRIIKLSKILADYGFKKESSYLLSLK